MSSLPTSTARLSLAQSVRVRTLVAAASIALFTVIWFALAIDRPLTHPDEGRYAEIPREMLLFDDWTTPHLNGVAYLEKPPLQYWATALAYRIFGVNEWTARLCALLSGWLNVVLVLLLGRRLWNTRVGVLAAITLATTLLHFAMGQILTLDMAFAFLMTAMLCAFCMAQVTRDAARGASRLWSLACWVLLGLAVLTKGIVAIVIAGSVAAIYVLWQRDWAVLRTVHPVTGLSAFAVVTVPWFVQVARANPDFLQFFFIHEHFQRYLTDVAQRIEPWWYFLAILAAGVLPWLPQMGGTLLTGWRATAPRGQLDLPRLLWTWCVFVLVFFSISNSKLAPYILPLVPALAVLTAARTRYQSARSLHISIGILTTFAIVLIVYGFFVPPPDPIVAEAVRDAHTPIVIFAVVAFAAAAFSWRAIRQNRPIEAVLGIATPWFLGLSMLFAIVGHEPLRSAKALAEQIPAELAAHAPLFSVQTYDQTLPFYLRRTMFLVDTHSELDFGLRYAPGMAITDMARFEQTWRALPQAVAIMRPGTYAELSGHGLPMRELGRDRHYVAVSRR